MTRWPLKILSIRRGGQNPCVKLSGFHSNLVKFLKKDLAENRKGAILIEFAFCVSVLMILIFYAHDLFQLSRYHKQSEFIAHQTANMLQNVSQNRTDKKITINDLKNITAATYQTFYPGTTMYYQGQGHVFGHYPHPVIFLVKGLDNGNASCMYLSYATTADKGNTSPAKMRSESYSYDWAGLQGAMLVHFKTNVAPSDIYPGLKINPGETKIIVESMIWWNRGRFSDGRSGNISPREVFSLLLVPPKIYANNGNENNASYMHGVAIFTPKSGLFDETPPR